MSEKLFDHDIFLSYATEDVEFCEKLSQRLKGYGLNVWFDRGEIEAGDIFPKRIRTALDSSKRVIAIWSPHYFKSEKLWTKLEWILRYCEDPHGDNRSLIPLLLTTCAAPEMFPNHSWLDFREKFDPAFRKLLKSLGVSVEEFVTVNFDGANDELRQKKFVVRERADDYVTFVTDTTVDKPLLFEFTAVNVSDNRQQQLASDEAVIREREIGDTGIVYTATWGPLNQNSFHLYCRIREEDGFGTVFTSSRVMGSKIRDRQVRLPNAHEAIFEATDAKELLQTGSVLEAFWITFGDSTIYAGRAVVTAVSRTGAEALCSAQLEGELSVSDIPDPTDYQLLKKEAIDVIERCIPQLPYGLTPWLMELQSVLTGLRDWLDLIQEQLRFDKLSMNRSWDSIQIKLFCESVVECLHGFSRRYDDVLLENKFQENTASFQFAPNIIKQRLHPMLQASPIVQRCYRKPLGYAGDHKTLDLIINNVADADALYSSILDTWFANEPSIRVERARRDFLVEKLKQEAARVYSQGETLSVLAVNPDAATELETLAESGFLARGSKITIVDFNEEALDYIRNRLQLRTPSMQAVFVKKSVNQMLKRSAKDSAFNGEMFDVIYCTSLLDYLSDNVCKRFISFLFESLAPNGVLLTTFLETGIRQFFIEHLLEWYRLHRSPNQLQDWKLGESLKCEYGASIHSEGFCSVSLRRDTPMTGS